MLIGLLLAGQHTSSTTSAWMGFFMAKDKALQERCYAEQKAVCGQDLPPLSFDQVNLPQPCNFIPPFANNGKTFNGLLKDKWMSADTWSSVSSHMITKYQSFPFESHTFMLQHSDMMGFDLLNLFLWFINSSKTSACWSAVWRRPCACARPSWPWWGWLAPLRWGHLPPHLN